MNNVEQDGPLNNSDEVSLKRILNKLQGWWRYILSKRLIILFSCIVGGIAGISYSMFNKPVYKAELSFALEDEKSGGGLSATQGLASQFGIDLGGGSGGSEFSGDNLLELMKSRTIIEKTILESVFIRGKKETLAEYYIDFNNFRKDWAYNQQLENIHFPPDADRTKFTFIQDSILGIFHRSLLKNNLIVDKVDKKLSIISISVKSTNELFAKYFAESLARVVSDFYVQTKTEKSAKNVAILQRQTDSVRQALNSAISDVANSTDAFPNPNPSLLALRVPTQRRQVDVQANTSILSEMVKNLEMAKMSLLQETPLIQVIDQPILPLEYEKYGKIKGLVVGVIIAGFISIAFLSLKKLFNDLLSN